jgi:hypothetical protein
LLRSGLNRRHDRKNEAAITQVKLLEGVFAAQTNPQRRHKNNEEEWEKHSQIQKQ